MAAPVSRGRLPLLPLQRTRSGEHWMSFPALLLATLTTVQAKAPADTTPKLPFAFADFTWLNGNSRQKDAVLDSKYVTGEFRADVNYIADFNGPSDHTLVGTS